MPIARRWMLTALLSGPVFLLGSARSASLQAATMAESSRVPSIKQVAIMPVYWQGQYPDGHPFVTLKKHLDESFAATARSSKRFSFTNDVITADLWTSPEGRKELSEEYEIDAFLNLTITAQSDLMQWTVRLLSPELNNYLTESDRVPYSWFQAASPAEIDQRLRDLVFRTLNRYPVDVFVTSVQGRFVSLSSGRQQNLFEGDELSFYESTLKSFHPVDSSWLSFNHKLLGKAKVIESKEQSSVASITSLSYENAIKVGDGARVSAVATRRTFQQATPEEQLYVPIAKDSPIVEAIGDSEPQAKPSPPTPLPPPSPRIASAANPPEAATVPATVADIPKEETPTPQDSPPTLPPDGTESDSLSSLIPISFKEAYFYAISEDLSFGGAAAMKSKRPDILVNHLAARGLHEISSGWEGLYSFHLKSSETKKGKYTGIAGQAEGLKILDTITSRIPSLNRALVGGLVRLETLGVTGERFGGWDAMFIGPTLHLQGNQHMAEIVQTIDYDIQASYLLQAIGSTGIAGKKRGLDSGGGIEFHAQAFFRGQADELEWGGLLSIESGAWGLSKGTLRRQNLGIGLTARMKL